MQIQLISVRNKLFEAWDKLSQAGTNCPSDSSDVLWLYNGIQFLMFIPIHNHASMMDCGTLWVLSRLQNQHGTNLERLGQIIPAGTNCPSIESSIKKNSSKNDFASIGDARKNFAIFFGISIYPGNSPLMEAPLVCDSSELRNTKNIQ